MLTPRPRRYANEAVKYDGDKPMLSLVPTHAMLGMGRALTYGAKKYANFNYKQGDGLDWDRYSSALLRHLFAWLGGEDKDPESGLNHIDHVLACSGMLADAVYSEIGKDTRFPSKIPMTSDEIEHILKGRYVSNNEVLD